MAERGNERMTEWLDIHLDTLSSEERIRLIEEICDTLTAQELRTIRDVAEQKSQSKLEAAKSALLEEMKVKIPAASSGAFRAGGHYADIARSASTCPSKEAICYVGGICPPNPLTRMPFLPTASSGASWHDFVNACKPIIVYSFNCIQ